MKKTKKLNKLSIFGYIVLLIGLLFILIPLLERSYNQIISEKKLKDFYQEQQKRSKEEIKEENLQIEKYNQLVNNGESTSTDPFLEEENEASLNYIENTDEIFGYIIIPRIEKRLPIYYGASMDHMAKGVGQVAGTHVPIGGKGNRSVLAGHRGWWGDTMLLYVDELQNGDYIYIERANTTLRYIVTNKEIISKYDWEKLDPVENEDMITLLTCLVLGSEDIEENRFIIDAIRDEEYINSNYEVETIDGKELNNKKQSDFSALETSQNEDKETPSLVKILNISMMAGAILIILVFLFVLIKFIKRIRQSLSIKKWYFWTDPKKLDLKINFKEVSFLWQNIVQN